MSASTYPPLKQSDCCQSHSSWIMRLWKWRTGSPGGPMIPGYPFVPGEPWGKDHTINQTGKVFYFSVWCNSRERDWQILTCSPFIPGRPGDPRSPCCPWRWWEWRMIRKWRRWCEMYVREKGSLGGNEPRTSQVNIWEGKLLTGLYCLPLRLPTFDIVLCSTPLWGIRRVIEVWW